MPFARFVAISILLAAVVMIDASPIIHEARAADTTVPTSTLAAFNYSCTQPATSSNSSEYSTEHFILENLPDPINPTPVFWSGRLNGNGSALEAAAEQCAQNKTGATIGQLMCNSPKTFIMPSDNSDPLWTFSSEVFAYYTGQKAYVVIGDAIVTSTWFNTEWPTLKENPKVEAVIGLNPNTCAEHCYWKCINNATECSVSFIFHCFDLFWSDSLLTLFSRDLVVARFRYLNWTHQL